MSGPNTILVVEDDKPFASQLKELMEFNGHVAVLAHTGPDGVDAFRRNRVDFILMDVMLPNVHGIRVLEQIRREPGGADVPVLLMSAVYRSETLFSRDMRRLGVVAFLSKPFSLMDLGRKIQNLLDLPMGGREEVRAVLADAHASASITGYVPVVDDVDEDDVTEPPRAKPSPPLRSRPVEDPPSGEFPPVPDAGPSLSEMPAAMREPRSVELDDDDSFLRVDTSRRLPKVGELSPGVCVHMLTTLFHSHSSGRFHLELGGSRRTIYLLNGYPVWVEAADAMAGLPLFLRREDLLTDEDLALIERAWAGNGGSLRKLLVDLELIRATDLDPILEAWIAAEVRDTVGRTGPFQFHRSDDFAGSIPVYEVNPIRAMWEGLPQHVSTQEVQTEISGLADRSVGRTRTFNRLFGYIGTGTFLRSLGEALLQPRSVAEVRARFPDDDGQISRCLWFLIHAGLVALSDSPTADNKETIRKWISSSTPGSRPAPRRPARAKGGAPPRTHVVEPTSANEAEHTVEFQTGRYGKEIVDKLLRSSSSSDSSDGGGDREALIVRDYVTRMDLNHYDFLGVPDTASAEAIDRAYQGLAPRYRLRNLGPDIQGDSRRKAKELLTRLVRVFDELSDPARRAGYDARLEREERIGAGRMSAFANSTGRMQAVADADLASLSLDDMSTVTDTGGLAFAVEDAEPMWWPGSTDASHLTRRRGRMDKFDAQILVQAHSAMAKQGFSEAVSLLEKLRGAHPSDDALLADLGWCRFARAPRDSRAIDKALEWTDLALAFQPDSTSALEVKARILASTDRHDEAVAAIKRFGRYQPGSEWVREQLTLRDQATAQPGKTGTGLRKLWGRKK